MKLLFTPDARDTLARLHEDPGRAELFPAVVRAVRLIRDEPESAEARRESWQTQWGRVWAVPIRTDHDEWLVVWQPEHPDTAVVLYLGPDV